MMQDANGEVITNAEFAKRRRKAKAAERNFWASLRSDETFSEYQARMAAVAKQVDVALENAKRQRIRERLEALDWRNPDIDELVGLLRHYSAPEIWTLATECGDRHQYQLAILLNAYWSAKFGGHNRKGN